jgi:transcriptional regulator
MYNIPYFKEKEKERLLQFLHDHPFAFLTGSWLSGKPAVTQIPVLIEERDHEIYLQGHIMRNTDHYKAFTENPQALAVFTGPHTYVSASWYSNPHMGSTWNYMSVHIHGNIRFLPEEGLIGFMKKLSLYFEKNNSSSPTVYDNLPLDYIRKMIPAIAGFEIRAESVENVFKLSQNRDKESYKNIIAHLEKQGGDGILIAQEMNNRMDELFPV